MKVAIVGTSKDLTRDEETQIRMSILYVLGNHHRETDVIISGGAKGVDSLAIEEAINLGYSTKEYESKLGDWDHYKERNIEIARECDYIYCITTPVYDKECYHHNPPQKHQKTAGCWTLNEAMKLGKRCQLLITSER